MADGFSHMDDDGNARMVDVSAKNDSQRTAIVRCTVRLAPETLRLLKEDALPKGDVLTTAKIAGIQAAKRTADLIPMCHPLPISYVDVRFTVLDEASAIDLECEVRTTYKTGVEMEALVGCQIAAATIYDMCKAVQKDVVIDGARLVFKSGGKSGTFRAE
ncbi:cyclic pyranopterin monophosphate synthase MoaC [Pseudodesulfovibrio indicus]|uniref:Cyclic pyranopterin monophosphate synthase n=1 Tax=Pseudodesulfovibrio indicus TaxID=1716143 RepID=A0A126QP96_9BACT|nr:cyclic pyranopterin monophosphate synthase MoaC [Pseudodesulfovibrio indicus]AMK11629.1 cyclic pyranopterin monophosphate synthase accessory protein [Pseudodesulfovibrio indicus]TDT90038.1 cyclic pyranopterin monophosphate synthase subunit MoaC [Pseudodesulfovibrio indicus]